MASFRLHRPKGVMLSARRLLESLQHFFVLLAGSFKFELNTDVLWGRGELNVLHHRVNAF